MIPMDPTFVFPRSAIDCIRDAKALQSILELVNQKINGWNASLMKGDGYIPEPSPVESVQWKTISRILKAAIRDDTVKRLVKRDDIKIEDFQVDHIFEVQYFAVVFLYTVADVIMHCDRYFKPDITDFAFALELVNNNTNLCALGKEAHGFKTMYFKAAAKKVFKVKGKELGASSKGLFKALRDYLLEFAPQFSAFLLSDVKVEGHDAHMSFKIFLRQHLFNTPWGSPVDQWSAIFEKNDPFSKNLTLDNYVPGPWEDDNVFYKVAVTHGKKKPKNKEDMEEEKEMEEEQDVDEKQGMDEKQDMEDKQGIDEEET